MLLIITYVVEMQLLINFRRLPCMLLCNVNPLYSCRRGLKVFLAELERDSIQPILQ